MPEGYRVTHTGKRPEGKLGQHSWLTSDAINRNYEHVYVKNETDFSVSVLQHNPQMANFSK